MPPKTLLLVLLLPLLRCAAVAPATPPPGPDVAEPVDPALELLDRLERSAEGLHDVQANVTYWKWDAVLDRRETRRGEVIYDVRSKRFAIRLRTTIVSGRLRDIHKDYIFDGSWLVEVDHDTRTFIKRQVVPPGRTFDPLKLGEGPFPLPVGQPRDEVVARFEASIAGPPADETLAGLLAGRPVEGLRLVPRPAAPEAGEIAWVQLYYDAGSLLPVGVVLEETGGDRKIVYLADARRNAGVDERKLGIEEPDPAAWRIDVRPWPE